MTAAKSKIAPGENSIDRANPRKRDGQYILDWRLRLPDGTLLNKRSKAPTIGETRRRAKETAKELLKTKGQTTWKSTDLINNYIAKVSIPAIENASLRQNTKLRYASALKLVRQACKTEGNTKGMTISGATTFRSLESILRSIAKDHGRESAHHARTVLSKYVLQSLIREGLITTNPLLKETIDLGLPIDDDDESQRRGGRALSREQYVRVVNRLLQTVPEDGVSAPKRGLFGLEDRVAKRRNTIDITLLQAATGLRVSEANSITWDDITFAQGQALIHISKAISKTHKMRDVPVLIPAVVQRLENRRDMSEISSDHVIGSPTDVSKIWDQRNCSKATALLYTELAKELDIELLDTARSHVWRATLNTMMLNSVPDIIRAAYFGHSLETNRDSYTDTTDIRPLTTSFNQLFKQVTAS